MAGAAGNDNRRAGNGCQPSTPTVKEMIDPVCAGGVCHFPADGLSWAEARTLRLLAGDSSISERIARRSSVAETTGKRMTKRQPKARKHCNEVELRAVLRRRHKPQAGSASNSQSRLSNNSMNESFEEEDGETASEP